MDTPAVTSYLLSKLIGAEQDLCLEFFIGEVKKHYVFSDYFEQSEVTPEHGQASTGRLRDFLSFVADNETRVYEPFLNCLLLTGHFDAVRTLEPSLDVRQKYLQLKPSLRGLPHSSSAPALAVGGGDGARGGLELDTTPQVDASPALVSPPDEYIPEDLPVTTVPYKYNRKAKTDEMYSMEKEPRGRVLIIDNEMFSSLKRRTGSHRDRVLLENIFGKLRFHVKVLIDQGSSDLRIHIPEFARVANERAEEAYFVIILSHGYRYESRDRVHSVDGETFLTDDIEALFNKKNAPNLRGKPKVFIYQSCRGNYADAEKPDNRFIGVRSESPPTPFYATNELDVDGTILRDRSSHTVSDTLIARSTVPGFASIRDRANGSWFIQSLCKVIAEDAHKLHFEKILKKTIRKVMEKKGERGWLQAPEYTVRGIFDKLYLNPEHSEEDEDGYFHINGAIPQEEPVASEKPVVSEEPLAEEPYFRGPDEKKPKFIA